MYMTSVAPLSDAGEESSRRVSYSTGVKKPGPGLFQMDDFLGVSLNVEILRKPRRVPRRLEGPPGGGRLRRSSTPRGLFGRGTPHRAKEVVHWLVSALSVGRVSSPNGCGWWDICG